MCYAVRWKTDRYFKDESCCKCRMVVLQNKAKMRKQLQRQKKQK